MLKSFWPELAAGLIWLGAFVLLANMAVWHDVSWQLWIARQLNGGVPLYSWLMEVNPPLWYWLAQPIDLLSALTGLPAVMLLVSAVFVLIGIALLLATILIAEWPRSWRAALYAGMLIGTLFITLADFAQREHEVLIAAIPYALLLARRVEGRPVQWLLALAVAVLATPMFALKHYFILIPLLLEIWLLCNRRRQWRPIRIETATLVIGALAYAAAIVLFTPDYLRKMVPALQLAYGDLRMPLGSVLINQLTLMLAISAFYFWHFRRELKPAAQAILLVAVAYTLSYFAQFKGWGYHITPAVACLLLPLILHLVQRPKQPGLKAAEIATAGMMLLVAIVPIAFQGPYRNEFEAEADQLLATAEPGSSAVMLTTKAVRMWPAVEARHLLWPSRYYHFWMLQTVANKQAAGQPVTGPLLDYVSQVRLDTVQDFACNPPDLLIADAISVDPTPVGNRTDFDMLGFFMQEPEFATLMQSYQPQSALGQFTVYHRIKPLPAPTGPCQTISISR